MLAIPYPMETTEANIRSWKNSLEDCVVIIEENGVICIDKENVKYLASCMQNFSKQLML